MVCLHGHCHMLLDDGRDKREVLMASNNRGVLIDRMIWHEMFDFSRDCVLLVLADDYYDEQDYIRDYGEFMNLAAAGEEEVKI